MAGAPLGASSSSTALSRRPGRAAAAVPGWLAAALLGCGLILPGLGSFGLWDPVELSLADAARELARGGLERGVPRLDVWLTSLAFRVLGENALAARLPAAVCGLCGVVLICRVGRHLFGRRAGLAAAIVAVTTPAYLLQCRQLTGDAVYHLALTASVGGLACYLWPRCGAGRAARRRADLVIGSAGLVAGFWARGLALGTLFPLLCLGIVVATAPGRRALEALPRVAVTVAVAAVSVAIGALWLCFGDGPLATLLGGAAWHPAAAPHTFEAPIRTLGYGLFPWVALAPLALASFVGSGAERLDRCGRHLVVVVVTLGYLLAAAWPAYVAPLRFPALPWLALGVGAWAAEIFDRGEVRAHWGLLAAGLIVVLVVDVTLEPRALAFSHLEASGAAASLVYPSELSIAREARPVGLGLALLAFLSLSGPPQAIDFRCRTRLIGGLLTRLSRVLDRLGGLLRAVGGARQRRFHLGFLALALLAAGWTAHRLVPRLSEHLSDRVLLETFRRCRGPHEPLFRYRVPDRGSAYHWGEPLPELRGQQRLLQMLAAPGRRFVLVPATALPEIDHAARKARVAYHVLDDRSSRVLLISNRLSGACARDRNPLRRLVLQRPPKPSRRLAATFEGMVQLIGFDLEQAVRRGGSAAITLYLRVIRPPPAGFKIFVHLDGPGGRINGDHEPLEGRLPTQLWLPGDYLVDPHEIALPLLTTAGGVYQVYVGFWSGPRRLRVVEGPSDGDNRVRLTTLRVR